jgi:hypothetical protein
MTALAAPLISNETPSTKERALYIDNLRLLVIVLVVSIHLAVTVSGFGSWYYVYGTHLDHYRPFGSPSTSRLHKDISLASCS